MELELGVVETGALVVALTHYAKRLVPDKLHDKVIPLIAIACGVGLQMIEAVTVESALTGLMIGLATTGLYGATKEVVTQ